MQQFSNFSFSSEPQVYFNNQANGNLSSHYNSYNYGSYQPRSHHAEYDNASSGYSSANSSYNISPTLERFVYNNQPYQCNSESLGNSYNLGNQTCSPLLVNNSHVNVSRKRQRDDTPAEHRPEKKAKAVKSIAPKPVDQFQNDNYEDYFDENGELDESENEKKRVLTREQRLAANIRERKRVNIMNGAFVDLRQVLPIGSGRKRRKMSRQDIVEGAIEYIKYLDELLNSPNPGPIDFEGYRHHMFLNE